jgi:RNA polymerase sigma factor (sigma-70 family)
MRPFSLPSEVEMAEQGSVSCWITQLQDGDGQAAQALWERYYPRLVALARKKLIDVPRRVADEEDVVQSALNSFYQRAQQGQFPDLSERDELWSLLVTITARKAINQRKHQGRAKRGGNRVMDEAAFGGADAADPAMANVVGSEPTPEFAADVAEQLDRFMADLEDPTHCVIALWKLEGRTNPEIARHLDCSLSAVERKLRLIRRRMSRWAED